MDNCNTLPNHWFDNSNSNGNWFQESNCLRPGSSDSLETKLSEVFISYPPYANPGLLGTPNPQNYRIGNTFYNHWSNSDELNKKGFETTPSAKNLNGLQDPFPRPISYHPINYSLPPLPNLPSQHSWAFSSLQNSNWVNNKCQANFNYISSEPNFSLGYQPAVTFPLCGPPHLKQLEHTTPYMNSSVDIPRIVSPNDSSSIPSPNKVVLKDRCFSQNQQSAYIPSIYSTSQFQFGDKEEAFDVDDFTKSTPPLWTKNKRRRTHNSKKRKTYYNIKRLQAYLDKSIEEEVEQMGTTAASPENWKPPPTPKETQKTSTVACYESKTWRNAQNSRDTSSVNDEPKRKPFCKLCRSNRETRKFYESHVLSVNNIVTCPILRSYKCPNCNGTGDNAHTAKYCPFKLKITVDKSLPTKNYVTRTSTGGFRVSKF